MKYKVNLEGRDGVYLISKEEVKRLVKDKCKKQIHCMIQSGVMLGADWDIKDFNRFVDDGQDGMQVERIAIVIPAQIGHHIAIPMDKLYLFDCGEIKEEELEILD